VDKKARTFSPWSHLVSLLYAQLTHAIGLNDVCDSLRTHGGLLVTLRGATPPSRNTLSHANKERDAGMAEKLFWSRLGHLQTLQLADFLGHGANAARSLVWTALLVCVLLRFMAFVHDWSHSFTRLWTLLRCALWQRWDLPSLLRSYGTAAGSFRLIATPQQSCFQGFEANLWDSLMPHRHQRPR
jgi:hypothetical protein